MLSLLLTLSLSPDLPDENAMLAAFGRSCATQGCPWPPVEFGDVSNGSKLIWDIQGSPTYEWLSPTVYIKRRPHFSEDAQAWLVLAWDIDDGTLPLWGTAEFEGYVGATFPASANVFAIVTPESQCGFHGWPWAFGEHNDQWSAWGTCSTSYSFAHPSLAQVPSLVAQGVPLRLYHQPLVWTNPAASWIETEFSDGTSFADSWSGIGEWVAGRPGWAVLK